MRYTTAGLVQAKNPTLALAWPTILVCTSCSALFAAEWTEQLTRSFDAAERTRLVETAPIGTLTLESLIVVYSTEPRRLNPVPDADDVRAAVVLKSFAFEPDVRCKFLLRLADVELGAAREDLSGAYKHSPSFAGIMLRLFQALAKTRFARLSALLREQETRIAALNWPWLGLLLEETLIQVKDEELGLGIEEAVLRHCENPTLTGLIGLSKAALATAGPEFHKIRATISYLSRRTDLVLKWGLPKLKDADRSTNVRAALLLAFVLGEKSARGQPWSQVDSAGVEEFSRFTLDSLEKLPAELKAAIVAVVLAALESQMEPPAWLTPLRDSLRKKANAVAAAAAEPQPTSPERAKRLAQLAALEQQDQLTANEMALLADALVSPDLEFFSLAARINRGQMERNEENIPYAVGLEKIVLRALRRAQLDWTDEGWKGMVTRLPDAHWQALVEDSLKGADSTDKVNACLIVKTRNAAQYLEKLRPLLADPNTWVRRIAEETWEFFGYTTFGGKVIPDEEMPDGPARVKFQQGLARAAIALEENRADDFDDLRAELAVQGNLKFLLQVISAPGRPLFIQRAALRMLARIGNQAAVKMILDRARGSEDSAFVTAVSEALEDLRNPDAVPLLLESVLDGTDQRLEFACRRATGRMPGETAAREVLRLYMKAKNDEARDALIECIGVIEAPEAVPVLAAALRPWPEDHLARGVLTGLICIEDEKALAALFEFFEDGANAPNEKLLTEAICGAVEYYKDRDYALRLVSAKLGAPQPAVRLVAASALAAFRHNDQVLAALQKAQAGEKDKAVVAEIIRVSKIIKGITASPPPVPPADGDF